MGLFRKKCEYCKGKIPKGEEIFRNVKTPIFKDKREKAFCCEGHVDRYEQEVGDEKKCGSCCG